MRKRTKYLLLLANGIVLVVVGVVIAAFIPKEPEYGGKRLSEWVEMGPAPPGKDVSRESAQASDAVRRIGTNAISFLLKWIDYDQPSWKFGFLGRMNSVLRGCGVQWMLSDTTQARAIRAVGAFGALGEIGGGAVPELTKRLYAPGQSGAAWVHAVTALKNLGAVGVPPIIGALTNSGPGCVRLLMMMHLEGLEMKYPQVVAALEDLLTDGDPDVRYWATNGLLQLIYDPEPVVRATMANALRKTDPKKLGTWRQK